MDSKVTEFFEKILKALCEVSQSKLNNAIYALELYLLTQGLKSGVLLCIDGESDKKPDFKRFKEQTQALLPDAIFFHEPKTIDYYGEEATLYPIWVLNKKAAAEILRSVNELKITTKVLDEHDWRFLGYTSKMPYRCKARYALTIHLKPCEPLRKILIPFSHETMVTSHMINVETFKEKEEEVHQKAAEICKTLYKQGLGKSAYRIEYKSLDVW